MNTDDIQNEVNALSNAMLAKGVRQPKAVFSVESGVQLCVMLSWYPPVENAGAGLFEDNKYNWSRAKSPREAIDMAREFVEAMPTVEEARTRQFLEALAKVIELGKNTGVDIAFINPLQATMKKLSHNIITDQRSAKAKNIDVRPLAADDLPF